VSGGGRSPFASSVLTAVVLGASCGAGIASGATAQEAEFELLQVRQLPAPPDGARRAEIRKALAYSAQQVGLNVVQISIEQRVGDGFSVAVEASGLVVDGDGHVVTIGSSLEQAGRVAVHFQEASQLRPRRARVLGIDAKTDVGVLAIGAIELPSLEFALPDPVGHEARYVVTLFGQPTETRLPDAPEPPLVLGFLQDPVRNPMLGGRRFDHLLRVSLVRPPESPGGVIASQDGRIAGILLQTPREAQSDVLRAPMPMLALPATTMQQGFEVVLTAAAEATAGAPTAAGSAHESGAAVVGERGPRRRAWLGFGARDLAESEFLKQLGQPGAVVVTDVFESSPALAAEIAPHDVVLAWNGVPLTSIDELTAHVAAAEPGALVELDCVRRLERRSVAVTLGEW
jgi:S1-C subfamily serine protease